MKMANLCRITALFHVNVTCVNVTCTREILFPLHHPDLVDECGGPGLTPCYSWLSHTGDLNQYFGGYRACCLASCGQC